MLKLLFKPVSYFDKIKSIVPSRILPIFLIALAGIMESIIGVLFAENISVSDTLNSPSIIGQVISVILLADIIFYIIAVLQVLIFPVIIKKLGGSGGSRRHALYIIGVATIPIIIQNIVHFIFPGTVWWNNFSHLSVLYYLSYSIFNLFNIWSILILVVGFARIYNVSYKKASILYVQFLLKLVPLAIISFFTS